MDQEKYTLIWHTYPEHLRGMMQDMLTSEDFADVTLVCDDNKSIMAHFAIAYSKQSSSDLSHGYTIFRN